MINKLQFYICGETLEGTSGGLDRDIAAQLMVKQINEPEFNNLITRVFSNNIKRWCPEVTNLVVSANIDDDGEPICIIGFNITNTNRTYNHKDYGQLDTYQFILNGLLYSVAVHKIQPLVKPFYNNIYTSFTSNGGDIWGCDE